MIISTKSMRHMLARIIGAVLLWFSLASPAMIAWAATSNTIPLHAIRSADCTGELVELSGTIHLVSQIQSDGSVVGHFNYQGVIGTGLTSGNTYIVSAVDNFHLSEPFPSSISSLRNFRLISQGNESNLLVTALYLITVNGNGEVTAFIDSLDMQCTP